MCLGDTSVQKLKKLEELMSENGHEQDSFQDRIIFASMSNDITKVQAKSVSQPKEVATYAEIQTWILVSLRSKKRKDSDMQPRTPISPKMSGQCARNGHL